MTPRRPHPAALRAAALACGALAFALAATALVGCGGSITVGQDAPVVQTDGGTAQNDAPPSHDGGQLVADFVAQGCEWLEEWSADGGSPDDDGGIRSGTVCIGRAPLTLTFVPLTSENVESYVWTFGEAGETPLRERTPTHTFVLPGSYDVSLTVGGPAGTLSVTHVPPFVQVEANPTGWPCDQSGQCRDGLECACPHEVSSDTACPAAFGGRGLCTRECTGDADCGPGAVCADLGVSAAWRGPLCVAACPSTTTCPEGTSCRDLPAKEAAGAWVSACFPAFLGGVGVPCLDADGLPVPTTCLGGLCLEVGTFGYCSAACEVGGCPAGSECAKFGGAGGHSVCLGTCDALSCSDDPLLGCEAPDAAGRLGFEIVDVTPPPTARGCAASRWTAPASASRTRRFRRKIPRLKGPEAHGRYLARRRRSTHVRA